MGTLARSKEYKKIIVEKGGIDAIVSAMHTHKKICDIQYYGCQTLGNLAFNDSNKKSIASKHGISAVNKAMENNQMIVIYNTSDAGFS